MKHGRRLFTATAAAGALAVGLVATFSANASVPPTPSGWSLVWSDDFNGAAAQGYWPAFWMLGAPFRGVYTNWPSVGEIDVMENVNGANTVWGTLHCGVAPGGPCNEFNGIGG